MMMKNSVYKDFKAEIDDALAFIEKEGCSSDLKFFIVKMKNEYSNIPHADRWSMVYDFINAKYPQYRAGGVITGLSYALEIFGQNDLLEGKICQKIRKEY
ncbi:MAG: hypothetical protein J6T34_00295 [Bacilli bacterium]|nr:hypothetical protein [Bacilli bacterium]